MPDDDDLDAPEEGNRVNAANALRARFVKRVEDEGVEIHPPSLEILFNEHFAIFLEERYRMYKRTRALRRHTRRCMRRAAEWAVMYASARGLDPVVVDEAAMRFALCKIHEELKCSEDEFNKRREKAGGPPMRFTGLAC